MSAAVTQTSKRLMLQLLADLLTDGTDPAALRRAIDEILPPTDPKPDPFSPPVSEPIAALAPLIASWEALAARDLRTNLRAYDTAHTAYSRCATELRAALSGGRASA